MRKDAFNFELPPKLIAQSPAVPRDSSRLMCLNKANSQIKHCQFNALPSLLKAGDVLVVNNSKVIPARLIGQRPNGSVCELLLLRQITGDEWECLAKPGKRIRPNDVLVFGDGSLCAKVLQTLPNGGKLVEFKYNTKTLYEKLDDFGRLPLPHYISAQLKNNEDYQTVYAKNPGSAAAPTAGLHFTPQLIQQLKDANIVFAQITLHVGLGTFRPVQEEDIENHTMHEEWYSIDEEAADIINTCKKNGGRIIAVGTTSCRTLESVMLQHGKITCASGLTNIFLYPGCKFNAINGLITNFHLPESTLIMLVSAFYGQEKTLQAYNEAIRLKYRFYSFGDAMIIL